MPILRKLRRLLTLGLTGYLGTVAVLLAIEDRLVFRPKAAAERWLPPLPELHVEEVWLTAPDGNRIHAWWCPRPGAKSAILFCHGNAGNLSLRWKDLQNLLAAFDSPVLIFDYPGYGQSTGSPSEAGCYAAADAAHDWLTQRFAPERIILLGQSLGGGVACDLAARRPCAGLFLFKTFSSLPELAGCKLPLVPCDRLMGNHFDNLAKIGRCAAPVFIAYGECDDLIPACLAQRLFEAAPEPKRLLMLPNAGHRGSFDSTTLQAVADFLRSEGVQPSSASR